MTAQARNQSQNVATPPGSGPGWGLGGGSRCSSCGAQAGLMMANSINSAYATFSLGQADAFSGAGSQQLLSAQPSAAMATPADLTLLASGPGVTVIQTNGQLRQVKASQGLADIVVKSAYSYVINYPLTQVGALTNGVYAVSGSPFLTWLVANPDGAAATNRLQLTETNGTQVSQYEIDYSNTTGSWKFEYPGGLREDEVDTASVTNSLGTLTALTLTTLTTRVPGGATAYKVKRQYQLYFDGISTLQGPYLVQEMVNPQTTTYGYVWGGYAPANLPTNPIQVI